MKTNLTRRQLLTRIAAVGGAVPLAKAMGILGVMPLSNSASAHDVPEEINPALGAGKTVAIIGAGLSGLAAAYELSRQGFECHIFEADKRPKGRTFTVRPDGSPDSWYQEATPSEYGGERTKEICTFDEVDGRGTLYFEAGAGRIPAHHRTVLHYCREFGIPLESYIFATRSNLVRSDGFNNGDPVQLRQFKHNLRGYLAEMFRTADPIRLNGAVSDEEAQKLMDELAKQFGELDDDFVYDAEGHSRSRAGYSIQPGAGNQKGEQFKPFAFTDLLQAQDIWDHQLYNDMRYYWQTSLLQPVGGIDQIAETFLRQPANEGRLIGNLVQLEHRVQGINITNDNVTITYQRVNHLGETVGEPEKTRVFDYCISTIAPSLLHQTTNNFSSDFQYALQDGKAVTNVAAGKVAWQSERFWENDDNYIYGGISWTSDFITQIWYPSSGFHNQRGILTGAYVRGNDPATGEAGVRFGKWTQQHRIDIALANGERLHPELNPERGMNDLSKAMTISWQNMAFQDGGWFTAPQDEDQNAQYQVLLNGQNGRFFMGGDAMSYVPGWMEGALTAGQMAANQVASEVRGA